MYESTWINLSQVEHTKKTGAQLQNANNINEMTTQFYN